MQLILIENKSFTLLPLGGEKQLREALCHSLCRSREVQESESVISHISTHPLLSPLYAAV